MGRPDAVYLLLTYEFILQDVLESEDILLDWMFRYSIMMDVVRVEYSLYTRV